MTGELTHMEKVSDNSAHASEEPRAERAEGHAWSRTSLAVEAFLPLNLSCTDNELLASAIMTPNPCGHSPVKM